jgi:hypothetical protein
MSRDRFTAFVLASAGEGGDYVGRRFVAISVAHQRTFDNPLIDGAPRQQRADRSGG